jgi:hypothetical protein
MTPRRRPANAEVPVPFPKSFTHPFASTRREEGPEALHQPPLRATAPPRRTVWRDAAGRRVPATASGISRGHRGGSWFSTPALRSASRNRNPSRPSILWDSGSPDHCHVEQLRRRLAASGNVTHSACTRPVELLTGPGADVLAPLQLPVRRSTFMGSRSYARAVRPQLAA